MDRSAIVVAALVAAIPLAAVEAADVPVKTQPVKAAAEAPFFFVNQNSIGYHYEFTATNPGAGETPKYVFTFTHFDVWKYGTNFINIDWLRATNSSPPPGGTPAAPCDLSGATGCAGYTEIYGLIRSTLGFNEVFGTKAFAAGPLTDVSLMVGADLNTDNTTLASAKRAIEAGVQFSFAMPYHGLLNLTPTVYKEWQHDGFAATFGTNPSGNVDFDTTWGFEWLYVQPLGFLPPSIPLTYKFFGTIHGPKGLGEPVAAATPRAREYYLQQNLELDVGKMIAGKGGMFAVWAGYRYWYNKFGIDHSLPAATFPAASFAIESTWLLGGTATF